jgi:hypothetical protein
MDVPELISVQLGLECIGFDRDGCLIRIAGPDPDDIARVYVYKHRDGYTLLLRHDLSRAVRREIAALGAEVAFHERGRVRAVLEREGSGGQEGEYQTYLFDRVFEPDAYPHAVRLTEGHRPIVEALSPGLELGDRVACAVLLHGRIVSVSRSVRENRRAGECYTFTFPELRRRGFGRQATAAWGSAVLKRGKLAFYSHAPSNVASQRIARGLRLRPCFRLLTFA